MGTYKEHCVDCLVKLGKDFACVHRWLDAYAPIYFPYMKHRALRHHKEGVEAVRHKWGDQAAEAARLHILLDEGAVVSGAVMCRRYGFDAPEAMTCDDLLRMYHYYNEMSLQRVLGSAEQAFRTFCQENFKQLCAIDCAIAIREKGSELYRIMKLTEDPFK